MSIIKSSAVDSLPIESLVLLLKLLARASTAFSMGLPLIVQKGQAIGGCHALTPFEH